MKTTVNLSQPVLLKKEGARFSAIPKCRSRRKAESNTRKTSYATIFNAGLVFSKKYLPVIETAPTNIEKR
jgi:hypothetical protein